MSDSEVQAAATPSEKPKRAAVTYPPARFEPGETIFAPKGRGGTVGVILTAPDDEGGAYTIRIIPGPIVKPRKDGTALERKALPTRTVVASSAVCLVPDGDEDFQRGWRPSAEVLLAFRKVQGLKNTARTDAEYLALAA